MPFNERATIFYKDFKLRPQMAFFYVKVNGKRCHLMEHTAIFIKIARNVLKWHLLALTLSQKDAI